MMEVGRKGIIVSNLDHPNVLEDLVWAEAKDDEVPKPVCRGIFKDSVGEVLIPWVVSDPYANIMCFGWDPDSQCWSLPSSQHHEGWNKMNGSVHVGQCCPQGVKEQGKSKTACTAFVRPKFLKEQQCQRMEGCLCPCRPPRRTCAPTTLDEDVGHLQYPRSSGPQQVLGSLQEAFTVSTPRHH